MKWLFKTYTEAKTPTVFVCEADDIFVADSLFQTATGLNPDKAKGVTITRFCPELPCNTPKPYVFNNEDRDQLLAAGAYIEMLLAAHKAKFDRDVQKIREEMESEANNACI